MANQHTGNRQLADAFESAKLKNPKHVPFARLKTATKKNELPAVNDLGADGVDHINTHYHSTTDLGRALSAYGAYPFNHPEYGRFKTVHGMMCWLANPNQPDKYRTMNGADVELLRLASESVDVKNYRYQFMEATWLKIKAHPEIGRDLAANTLPIDNYYYQNLPAANGQKSSNKRIRVRPPTANWMIRGFEEIRQALIQQRAPRLDFLLIGPERVAMLKRLARESETLEVTLAPIQIATTADTPKPNKGQKKYSPSEQAHRQKFFDGKKNSKQSQQLARAQDGSVIHQATPPSETPSENAGTAADTNQDNSTTASQD